MLYLKEGKEEVAMGLPVRGRPSGGSPELLIHYCPRNGPADRFVMGNGAGGTVLTC